MAYAHGFKGHNIHAGVDHSPPRHPRPTLRPDPSFASMHDVAALRQQLGVAEHVSATTGRAHRHRPQLGAPLPQPQRLTASVSLPAIPPKPARDLRPPWALHDDSVEPNIGEEALAKRNRTRVYRHEPVADSPPLEPRRISTRERVWRSNMEAASDGLAPDPLAVHILMKHGKRFKPGGLASQTGLSSTASFQTFAIANARICCMQNGLPFVRTIPHY